MKKTTDHVRIIGSACLVLSLLLLFANWLVPTDGEDFTADLMEDFAEMEFLAESLYDKSIAPVADCFANGKLSPAEGFTLSRKMVDCLNLAFTMVGASRDSVSAILDNVKLYSTVYTIIFLAVVISGILTLIIRINGKCGTPDGVFFASQIALLLFVWIVASACDGEQINLSYRVAWLTAFASVALAVPASVLERLPLERINLGPLENIRMTDIANKITGKASETVREQEKEEPWTCPLCGNLNPADKRTCGNCERTAAQKKIVCFGCGCMVDGDSVFCGHCGQRLM